MSGSLIPKFAMIDNFLPTESAQALLDHALENAGLFEPAKVVDTGSHEVKAHHRQALATADLGDARSQFTAAVEAHFEYLCKAVGIAPFPIAAWDVEMAAHRDGGFFNEHIDTKTAANRDQHIGDRMISMVYYLHRPEVAFTGGDLLLKPYLGNAEAVRITPEHNRLVAFPSIARHQVETVHVPGDAWQDARFSINCWLLRSSGDQA
ncbi:2OG-Fe(II) oxygenase [Parerythrobacter aestuarii]|uniref:2OG-Fe(II) oxygenase n=1 Tax=Parerythrobacter aestuarii TaxID=3020909 RepID=UPI0024DE1AAD|nr:2OG-Fe(II) oxygenase [Parerythrobacter aestuarii]